MGTARFVREVWAVLGIAILAGGSLSLNAKETTLPKATDLRRTVTAGASRAVAPDRPLLILFSLPGCPHCEALRVQHLLALASVSPPSVDVRQIDLGSDQPVVDFNGKRTNHAAFAAVEKVKFAPVVALYAPDGTRLGEPLIGAMLPDFYAAYLEDAISTAVATLKSRQIDAKPRKSL